MSAGTLDLDVVSKLISQPAWDNIGIDARLSWAFLTSEGQGRKPLAQAVAEMLDDEEIEYENDLGRMSQTRIALLHVADMMKASVIRQWKAVDAYLASKGLPLASAGVDDELCDDEELLALRSVFEAGREGMRVATEAVAKATKRSSAKAYAAQNAAIDADSDLVDRVTAMRARTKEGIQFKREVRAYWDDCAKPELDRSIFNDLVAYVEASP